MTAPPLAATFAALDAQSLVLVLAASTLGAILSRVHHRLVLPTVVVEIVLGILIGPQVLDWAQVDSYIGFLANFGLVFLFFFAGRRGGREARAAARARARHDRLGGLARARLRVRLRAARGRARRGGLAASASRWRRPRSGRSSRCSPTPGCCRRRSAAPCSGRAWPASSGRSSSSRSSSPASTAPRPRRSCSSSSASSSPAAPRRSLRARPPAILRVLRDTVHTTGQAAVRLSVLVLAALVLARERRRLRLRARRARGRPDRRPRARHRRTARSSACASRESASAS